MRKFTEPKVSSVRDNSIVDRPLKLAIDQESVNIYVDMGEEEEPVHIAYWHLDEVEEDATVMISIANAISQYYTSPQRLLEILGYSLIVK